MEVLYQTFVNVFNMMKTRIIFSAKWKGMRESDNSLQRYKTVFKNHD
ncbi:MAG: hypothetical protein H6Q65_198 [Firmicutes bacterium]|nr:hypothetical protein [Bacillota bacterium]